MGNQMTETQEQFRSAPGVRQKYHFQDDASAGLNLHQPYNLSDHHKEGPSKVTKNYCKSIILLSKVFTCYFKNSIPGTDLQHFIFVRDTFFI